MLEHSFFHDEKDLAGGAGLPALHVCSDGLTASAAAVPIFRSVQSTPVAEAFAFASS